MSTFGPLAANVFKPPRADRFGAIDTLRGVAIVMMVVYHLMWDFWFLRVLPNVTLQAGFWKYF